MEHRMRLPDSSRRQSGRGQLLIEALEVGWFQLVQAESAQPVRESCRGEAVRDEGLGLDAAVGERQPRFLQLVAERRRSPRCESTAAPRAPCRTSAIAAHRRPSPNKCEWFRAWTLGTGRQWHLFFSGPWHAKRSVA